MIIGDELTNKITYCYYYHNLLNHLSLSNMYVLAWKGKLPLKLLKIKAIPLYVSFLYDKVHMERRMQA